MTRNSPGTKHNVGHYHGVSRIFNRLATGLAFLLAGLGMTTPAWSADYIPLQEISRGMTGYGLTVFEGSRIDTFTVTVIGIQERVRAAGSLILIEVGGHGLELSSIAQGMSGSPVFIEGRFAGALAFGWGGALRPLAGVTPAKEILALPTETYPNQADGSGNRTTGPANNEQMMRRLLYPGDGNGLAEAVLGAGYVQGEAAVPLIGAGIWPTSEELILQLMKEATGAGDDTGALRPENWFISPLGFSRPGTAGATGDGAATLYPGSACAVPLVTGDAQLGAIGTVTWVEGDDVFMFGHPFMQRGPVNLPLATAEILTVFPSRELSFKLGSVGRVVGTVHHDQRAGLSGRLGPSPQLIPVDLEVQLPGTTSDQNISRQYSFAVVSDPQLTPRLIFWALYNSLLVDGDDASGQNLEYNLELDWEGPGNQRNDPLILAGVASGPGGVGRLSSEWMAPISLLLNNPFAEASLISVRATLKLSRPQATATVSGLVVPRMLPVPGQQISCQVEVTPRLGSPQMLEVPVFLPEDLEPGNYRLAVASAAEMFALEAQRAAGIFQVTSLDGMMKILRTGRSGSTLVVALLAPGQGMVLEGKELSGLPGRVSRVIRSGNMEADPTLADIVARQELPTGWLLQGHAVRNIEVAPRPLPAKQERRP